MLVTTRPFFVCDEKEQMRSIRKLDFRNKLQLMSPTN